jgi:bile acid:Na+ symporter, BASS family
MELSKLVPILVQFSIALVVVALGLKSRAGDVHGLWRRPGLLARSLFALLVLVPAFVVLTVLFFRPTDPVKVALVLLAISPVPPFLPLGQSRLSSDSVYIYGLLVITSLVSIVYVPAAVAVIDMLSARSLTVSLLLVAKIVLVTVLAPLCLGALVRRFAPSVAARAAAPVLKLGVVLLLICLVLILLGSWRAIIGLIGNGTVLVIAVVAAISLATGHALGGPDPEDRVVLALAAGSHHPGVALAIAAANFPGEHSVGAAILLYLLLTAVFSLPYKKWWSRSSDKDHVRSSTAPNASTPTSSRRTAA